MTTITIDQDNNITGHAKLPADASQACASAQELANLTAHWPASRFVETWNGFAGVAPFQDLKPVKKFTSRKYAVARIFEAVARLAPNGAEPAQRIAPRNDGMGPVRARRASGRIRRPRWLRRCGGRKASRFMK